MSGSRQAAGSAPPTSIGARGGPVAFGTLPFARTPALAHRAAAWARTPVAWIAAAAALGQGDGSGDSLRDAYFPYLSLNDGFAAYGGTDFSASEVNEGTYNGSQWYSVTSSWDLKTDGAGGPWSFPQGFGAAATPGTSAAVGGTISPAIGPFDANTFCIAAITTYDHGVTSVPDGWTKGTSVAFGGVRLTLAAGILLAGTPSLTFTVPENCPTLIGGLAYTGTGGAGLSTGGILGAVSSQGGPDFGNDDERHLYSGGLTWSGFGRTAHAVNFEFLPTPGFTWVTLLAALG